MSILDIAGVVLFVASAIWGAVAAQKDITFLGMMAGAMMLCTVAVSFYAAGIAKYEPLPIHQEAG